MPRVQCVPESDTFPKCWKRANVIPIAKTTGEYRAISILSVFQLFLKS